MVFTLHIHSNIKEYGSTPYVGVALKKMAAVLNMDKTV